MNKEPRYEVPETAQLKVNCTVRELLQTVRKTQKSKNITLQFNTRDYTPYCSMSLHSPAVELVGDFMVDDCFLTLDGLDAFVCFIMLDI